MLWLLAVHGNNRLSIPPPSKPRSLSSILTQTTMRTPLLSQMKMSIVLRAGTRSHRQSANAGGSVCGSVTSASRKVTCFLRIERRARQSEWPRARVCYRLCLCMFRRACVPLCQYPRHRLGVIVFVFVSVGAGVDARVILSLFFRHGPRREGVVFDLSSTLTYLRCPGRRS